MKTLYSTITIISILALASIPHAHDYTAGKGYGLSIGFYGPSIIPIYPEYGGDVALKIDGYGRFYKGYGNFYGDYGKRFYGRHYYGSRFYGKHRPYKFIRHRPYGYGYRGIDYGRGAYPGFSGYGRFR